MIRSHSHVRCQLRGLSVVLIALGVAVPRAAWSQSSWPNYPDNTAISVTSGGYLGLGTTSPQSPLHIKTASTPATNQLLLESTSTYVGDGPGLSIAQGGVVKTQIYAAYGSTYLYSPVGAFNFGTSLYGFDAFRIFNDGIVEVGSTLRVGSGFKVGADYLATAAPTNGAIIEGNVGIGTNNPQHLLHVAGTIGAKEVLVTSTGADYVFEPGYDLKPLSEVASYIDANHHLPDIPSAEEVQRNGMGVGDMESKLLAKVEELTLHLIQQDKDNRELREHMADQEKQNRDLRDRVAQLEARLPGASVTAARQ